MVLDMLFGPRSVLLVGSSKIRESCFMITPEIFSRTKANLAKFRGKVFVCDIEQTSELPACDLALITLPAEKIFQILPSLKAKFVVILSGGFDAEQRKRLKALSKFRIIGPNSVCGLLNSYNSLNTSFEHEMETRKGGISVISQSGGIGVTLLDYMIANKIGFSRFAWMGDMVDMNECDLLERMLADVNTKVVLLYLEALKEPRRFMAIARRARKPIIILKSGVSKESKNRALTHTDSLSTDAEIYSSAFKQAGVIEVESVRELFNCGLIFERYGRRKISRIAIVSNTGGSSILASDFCYRLGLELAELEERTKKAITKKYPKIKIINPVDMAADANGERYKFVLDIVASDKNVDAIIVINQLKSCLLEPEELEIIKRVKTGKVIIDCAPGQDDYSKIRFFLGDALPTFSAVEDAVKALKKLQDYGKRF